MDDNHHDIVGALRQIGVGVEDTSAAGSGLPDLLCAFRGVLYLLEIKDGSKSPSRRKLTGPQVRVHAMLAQHGVRVHVVESVAAALAVFGAH